MVTNCWAELGFLVSRKVPVKNKDLNQKFNSANSSCTLLNEQFLVLKLLITIFSIILIYIIKMYLSNSF